RYEMGQRLAAIIGGDASRLVAARREDPPAAEPRPRDTSLDSSLWRRLFPSIPWPSFEAALDEMLKSEDRSATCPSKNARALKFARPVGAIAPVGWNLPCVPIVPPLSSITPAPGRLDHRRLDPNVIVAPFEEMPTMLRALLACMFCSLVATPVRAEPPP